MGPAGGVDRRRLNEVLTRFASVLVARYEIGRVLDELVDDGVVVLGGVGAGVVVRDEHGGLHQVAGGTDTPAGIREHTDPSGPGPCRTAFKSASPAVSDDLAAEPRWPDYRRTALAAGLHAVVGLPVCVEGIPIGVLWAVWGQPREVTDARLAAGRLLADMAAAYLLNLRVSCDADRLVANLQHAVDRAGGGDRARQ